MTNIRNNSTSSERKIFISNDEKSIKRQRAAIDDILSSLQSDERVLAIFLKGSLARSEGDEHSDVDMYCVVKKEYLNEFINQRIEHLEAHRKVIFESDANFVGPQIVAVFDNGLHFDLYTVTPDDIPQTGEILTLHDPEGLLDEYQKVDLSLDSSQLARIFNSFNFSLLEYDAAYQRDDLLWACRLTNHLLADLAKILRWMYHPQTAQLGIKGLKNYIDLKTEEKLMDISRKNTPDAHPQPVQQMVELAHQTINNFPREAQDLIQWEFCNFISEKVRRLK